MTKRKKKIKLKGLLFLVLIIYLIICIMYYVFKLTVKNVEINGNNIVTEEEIINASLVYQYNNILKISNKKIENNIKNIDLVDSVSVKKNLFGKVTITIIEAKILFYNASNDKIVLSNKKEIENNSLYNGYATLINYTPDNIYENLIIGLSKIDENILNKISEIKYDPDIKDDIILDEERFKLIMNDKNTVYIDIPNIDKLAKYNEIYEILDINKPGILYLDSNSKNTHFEEYK